MLIISYGKRDYKKKSNICSVVCFFPVLLTTEVTRMRRLFFKKVACEETFCLDFGAKIQSETRETAE